MEARKLRNRFYGSTEHGEGKRTLEWDLNDWRWDGDLFIATPLNSVQTDCTSRQLFPSREETTTQVRPRISSNSSSSCSEETYNLNKRELEKRRRGVECESTDELIDQSGSLTLKLGGQVYPIVETEEGKYGKKTKLSAGSGAYRVVCQVENCESDLSIGKDYHRRHKVCEMHSKASKAVVGNVMQRFCQQCSRFHVLQEFDEGKRSCRRRLAGHNRRRRKTHPEATTVNGGSSNDDQSSNYLLISLLRILSNMHPNNSDQAKDQDLLSHLLRNLASSEHTTDGQNVSGIIRESKEMVSIVGTAEASLNPRLVSRGHECSRNLGSTSQVIEVIDAQGPLTRTVNQSMNSASEVSENRNTTNNFQDGVHQALPLPREDRVPVKANTSGSAGGRAKFNNFDLNNVYNDLQDYEGLESSQWMQKDSHQSSPPQTSLNSDSLSGQSPSSSGGDAQSRTDRIVFKLFGKDPSHFPVGLRSQILNWLSHSPTDIESYIRPGCIILTIYLRLADSTWKELRDDLSSSLRRLLDVSDDTFWRTGWVFTRVQHHIAFINNGQIVLDIALPLTRHNHSKITSVTPIAVPVSEGAKFLVEGYNLPHPHARVQCALEGKYLLQDATSDLLDTGAGEEHNDIQYLSFSCFVPDVTGRGFIEVEDHGLSSGFFPFIVAEQDICSEIRMLESAMKVSEFNDDIPGSADKVGVKSQALDFIHELGWLLRRSRLRSRLDYTDSNSDFFSFTRFRWLVEFSVDHDWCAVVKKLLDILFDGNVGPDKHLFVDRALLETGLLHRAVRRRCRQVVKLLLTYVPDKSSAIAGLEPQQSVRRGPRAFMFRPDAVGPGGLTPLHIAASSDGSEKLLDALTDDPELVGVEAWRTVRDNTGLTPEDYARLRGHYSYILLVHEKFKKISNLDHVVLDIPNVLSDYNSNLKQSDRLNPAKVASFQICKTELRSIKMQQLCKICDQQVAYGSTRSSLVYRPAMLSMLAIAAVCVCVGLLFKSSPEVLFVYPFRWELLEFGSM